MYFSYKLKAHVLEEMKEKLFELFQFFTPALRFMAFIFLLLMEAYIALQYGLLTRL